MEPAGRLGTALQWLSLVIFVGLALWLETDIISVTGGGLTLLMLGAFLPSLRLSNPAWTTAHSGMALLANSMFSQNLLTGLVLSVRLSKFDSILLLLGSFIYSIFALALIIGQFLPPGSKPRDYSSRARKLWFLATGVVFGTLMVVAVVVGTFLGVGGKIEDLSLLTSAATLVASSVLGVSLILLLPPLETNLARGPLSRQLTVTSGVLLLGGFLLESLRGNWLLWLLTSLASISPLFWLNWIARTHQSRAAAS